MLYNICKCNSILRPLLSNVANISTSAVLLIEFVAKTVQYPRKKDIYAPMNNFDEEFNKFTRDYFFMNDERDINNHSLEDPYQKFGYLSQCQLIFNKAISNSYLSELRTVDDVYHYFHEPVISEDTLHNLASIKNMLPKNLHIQKDPIVYDARVDNMFGGITAYPNMDIVETDLEAQKKYPSIKGTSTRKIEIENDDLW